MRSWYLAAVALATLALIACGADSGERVALESGRRFAPATLTVSVGATVTWASDTNDAHTVTAYEDALPEGADFFTSGGADSEQAARDALAKELIPPGEAFEWTFEVPGRYEYFCIPHESDGMKGVIIVE